jgi:hypothetical protein
MRKYQVVMCSESFNDSYYRRDPLEQPTMFDSVEAAQSCSRWMISGALYIVSFDPTARNGWPGVFKIEISR